MTSPPAGARPRRRATVGLRAGLAAAAVGVLTALTTVTALPGYAGQLATTSGGVAATAVAATAATAVTATAADAIGVTLGAVSPAIATPGQPVTVTGTLTARTTAMPTPVVRVVASATPIMSRPDVTAWATSTAFLGGTEVGRVQLGGPLAVGQSVPFSVTVPAGRLSLSRTWGVIPIAVQARDAATGASQVLRTFVGWQRRAEYAQISVGVVAPVTLPPDAGLFDSDPARRTAAWQSQLAPTGEIAHTLDGTDADGPGGPVPVTWAVDPAVLGGARGATGPQAGDPIASIVSPLLTRLAAGAGRHTLWALPYADTDVAATVAADPTNSTVRAQVGASTSLGNALGVPVTTGVAWPTDGSLAEGRVSGLRSAYQDIGLTGALISSSSLPVTSGYSGQAVRRAPDALPLLAWDDELSRLATRTADPADGPLATQQLVAETATIVGESPGVARSFLIAIPRGTDPDPGALRTMLSTLAGTPWVRVVGTDELLRDVAGEKPATSSNAGSWTAAGPPQVNAASLARITTEEAKVTEVATILGAGGDAVRARWTTTLDQLTSARWRSAPAQLSALETNVMAATAAATSGIHVADQTINFLADEGTLQVTVVNDLSVPVNGVRLVLGPTNPRLIILAQPDPVTIAAGSKAVVQVRARAVSAGLVPVNTSLTTQDGTVIGASSAILVRANPPGTTLYVVSGIVLGLVLVLGIVRTLRRPGRAQRARLATTAPSETSEASEADAQTEAPRTDAPPPVSSDRTVG